MDLPKPDFESSLLDLDNKPNNVITKLLESIHSKLCDLLNSNYIIKLGFTLTFFAVYNLYLTFAVVYHVNKNKTDIDWCNGVGFLLIFTGLLYTGIFYGKILKPRKHLWNTWIEIPLKQRVGSILDKQLVQVGIASAAVLGLVGFLIYDTEGNLKRLTSCAGSFLLIGFGVIISKHPGRIKWRHVVWGMGLQFMFGLVILRWNTGRLVLNCISDKLTSFLGFVRNGSSFVYGYLATGIKVQTDHGEFDLPGVFAFRTLCAIYLFSFMVSILYHFGIMTWLVSNMGWILEITVGTTAAENMNAAANIFLGMTESPLVVKPFIGKMTNSELHAVMTGGFSTVAGAALGAYITFGIDASHLLSASVMSAPAALAYSKILYPETKKSITNSKDIYTHRPKKSGNFLDAAAQGASQAVFLILNIIASLIAITAFVAMLNSVVNWFGILVGWDHITFEWIVGKIFTPLSWAIGIDDEEVGKVARLLGTKTVVNEFVAYSNMKKMCLSPRSVTITTYALCCFANFSSVGVTIGGLTAICPERRHDISKIVLSAFIGGNVAPLLTACVAGTLITDTGYVEWIKSQNCTETIFDP